MTATHTATPWRVSSFEQGSGGSTRVIMGSDNFSIAHVMDRSAPENEADAAFIVEAVNSYASLKARIAELEAALQFIADGYDNHDVNHVDYRVKVYQVSLEALQIKAGS
jgi:hypothetical protein